MANKFLSKKIIIPAVVIFGGLTIATGVLLFPNILDITAAATGQNPQWAQSAGEGIAVPACGSTAASVTCSNGLPSVSFNWQSTGPAGNLQLYVRVASTGESKLNAWACDDNQVWEVGTYPLCYPSGSYLWNGIRDTRPAVFTWNPPADNTTYSWDLLGLKESFGSGTFTTPNCTLSPPTVSMSANPTTINQGQSSTLNWSSANATGCNIDNGVGSVAVNGSTSVSPSANTTYTITCSGPGGSAQSSAAVAVNPPQTLSVSKSGAGSGTITSSPAGINCGSDCAENYNYNTSVVLTASAVGGSTFTGWSGEGCSGTGTCTVVMTQARNVTAAFSLQLPGDFSLSPPSAACNSVSLSWTASAYADAYRILKGAPRVDISPYQPYTALNFTDYSVSQNTDYIYQIEAYNVGGTNRSNARNITTPYCAPTLNFSGDPTSIYQGQSTTLTWLSTFATSCTASGAWSGSKAVGGSEVVVPLPPPSVTYTLNCSGPGGSTGPQSVIINITSLALPNWKEIIPR